MASFEEALESLVSSKKASDSITQNNYIKIQSVVSDFYSVSVDDIVGKSRKSQHSLPRFIAMYLIRRIYDVPYKTIGEMFGGRDHSSVINACNSIELELETDLLLKKAVNDIMKKLGVEK